MRGSINPDMKTDCHQLPQNDHGCEVGSSERQRELRRRRKRKKKYTLYKRRAEKASPSEKTVLAEKLRNLTPGYEVVIEKLQLGER